VTENHLTPRVSVIIPSYNHERFVGRAIESALAQTLPPHEIVVIDDGSTDETTAALNGYAGRVRAVRQTNAGVSAARNAGVKLSTGELLAFLDADDEWDPRKLELQVTAWRAEPQPGLVHCGVEDIDGDGHPLRQHLEGMSGPGVAAEMLLFRRPTILGGGSGVLIPRAVFEGVGGFDLRLSTSADWDLYYRIASRYPVAFVPEPLLRYRLHGSNMHGNIRAMEHDMLLAYEKAFADPAAPVQTLRRRAYGNLHTVLAGSFFGAGQKREFARHAARGLLLTPGNVMRFLSYPLRRLRRRG
jgi:glycosyltransferase involved in cell wall biosynthesis